MLELKVRETIEKRALLQNGAQIVVGVSGGPDSVCLLHVLWELSGLWDLKLHAVHINHCIRGAEADGDQNYTVELCRSLSVPCTVFTYDVRKQAYEESLTTEEMGRILRYDAFEKVRQEMLADVPKTGEKAFARIAVAQNQNDQAETVLMRILRGTGLDGLAAMEYVRDGRIIRPLLEISRAEIEEYCTRKGLRPRTDSTNLAPDYTRNKIRLELIPYLMENYNENLLAGLSRLTRSASEDKAFLYECVERAEDKLVRTDEKRNGTGNEGSLRRIMRRGYAELSPAISKRLILKTLKDIGLLQDVTSVQLDRADALIREGGTGDCMDFPHAFGLRISYEDALLFDQAYAAEEMGSAFTNSGFCYKLTPEEIIPIPELNAYLGVKVLASEEVGEIPQENGDIVFLDGSDSLWTQPLYIRTRRPGDSIVPLGMQGTKKLQDFFVDQKIPREKRDKIPLVCRGQDVLWIVGNRINENYKVKKGTEKVVRLEFMHLL